MSTERINPAELARPSGFSHAVAATGRMLFLAGQTGVDRDGNVAEGGVVPQFERALTNLLTALGAAGGLPSDLVSLTIYLIDVEDYQAHEPALRAFGSSPPAEHEAFAGYVRVLTDWRRLPYLDPRLPAELLPEGWIGIRAADLFFALRALLEEPARAYVKSAISG